MIQMIREVEMMKTIRASMVAAVLLALVLLLVCGTAMAEEGGDTSSGTLQYTGDMDALRTDLREVLEKKRTRITVKDATAEEFDNIALYYMLRDEMLRLAPEYGCVLNSRYTYIGYLRKINITVSYPDFSDLPAPFELTTYYSGYTYTQKDSKGNETTDKSFAGKRVLHVMGRTSCPNTQAFLSYVTAAAAVLEAADVEVAVTLVNLNDNTWPEYEELLSSFHCWKSWSGGLIQESAILRHFDQMNEDLSITFPVVMLADTDGNIIYCSTGYVEEPLRVIATAIRGKAVYPGLLIIPASVTEIEAEAFMNCTDIEEVRFAGDSITAIGEYAFMGCTNLKCVTLPVSVRKVDRTSFRDCSEDLTVYCSRNSPFIWDLYNENVYFKYFD